MDLTGKGFSPAHNYLQHASGIVAAYGLGQTPLTTAMFKATSHSIPSPVYSGTLTSSLSPSHTSHTSFSNGHNITSLHRHAEKLQQSDSSPKPQIYASPAPVFNRHKDSFPYGISGVSMPNYNYHGDVYQFTSNGYPRKSRTCSYCGKVFTRSTTRRYHEKRCPLLRAAVSSYMGDDNNQSASGSTTSQSGSRGIGDIVTHSYKGQAQSLGPSLSGMNRSNEPQELPTSVLAKSPPSERRLGGDSSLLSGYQTSVIVKQEHHELEALANMTSNTSKSMSESDDSDNRRHSKLDTSVKVSPGYSDSMLNLSMSKSPHHSSPRSENLSSLGESYLQGRYGERMNDRQKMDNQTLPPHLAFARNSYSVDFACDESGKEKKDGIKSEDFSSVNGQDEKIDQMSDLGSAIGESESVTSEKRDGKVYSNHKCGICGKGFESAGKLHLHEQLHTKFKPYGCKFCGQKFAKSAQRVEHEKMHNGTTEEATHICAVCGTSFTRKYSLKLHMCRWHQDGPWLCRHCGKASETQKELKTHLYSHNLPRQERESLMYLPDAPLNYGAMNVEDSGGDEKDGEEIEGEVSTSQEQPVKVPSMQEMEMCNECGRDFPKGYLRYHLKSHEAQKPYSCPICAKRFGYKNNMKSHIKLHTGIKPFQCKVCGAKFTRGSTLRRHARRHGIIADSVWDLFIKPNYNKSGDVGSGGATTRSSKLESLSTSRNDAANSSGGGSGSSGVEGGDSNYLATTLPSNPSHRSLYPLYGSLGQLPHLGLYSGLTSTSYFTQHLPQSSVYAASSQFQPQHDALNLSLNKGSMDQSDQSSFSNISAELSRSRSRSLSGSDNRRILHGEGYRPVASSIGVQVNMCCPPSLLKHVPSLSGMSAKSDDNNTGTSASPSETLTPTQHLPGSPGAGMEVVPYVVSSPSQRLDTASPALSGSSGKDYSMETISSLISTGRMFKCFHCECYFSEYAMYRIHSKLHINDDTRPFVCMVCGEDCHDRVYFALHLAEHLQ
ncbi:zinc finger protein 236-like [Mya arenaria]|uniref:zinc finger protein 236-like n=1 Tax=Mya arenaria TaxID=6604 RepID=UPI0022E810C7|nr:zinc finger protein 236-like [Mya arenaria]XP_052763614.1 zinc finger protein 236-like [Mya arenaria]XP_052763615.1 zinc finger protein 236-like [Mya arenaria]XP_052763616.1 zinc finger protein 236-like [Mya arenaria]XP_052763617.1 zinc finger protein 236-like [Mya arenaria]XP_052763619.1 zinc finger protein 236-like [Mya arenaria]XP_052763620.1 zinc finger protein 236-like [Mya arenaria]XP_052763621.1 zinc finger protein 236-like [Mya arenaria]XP_052763690.1 zinc finger protein 236-like